MPMPLMVQIFKLTCTVRLLHLLCDEQLVDTCVTALCQLAATTDHEKATSLITNVHRQPAMILFNI